MTVTYWTRLRTLVYLLVLPIPLIGVVPWWLHRVAEGPLVWSGSGWQWFGVWLILNGVGLAGWCVNLFNAEGRGTPVPFDPPRRFVVSGPYRFVRNPMVLGIFLVLWGEAVVYQSQAVLLYALGLMGAGWVFVRYVEEPELERRFGEAYLVYKRQVPRWIPRPGTQRPPRAN